MFLFLDVVSPIPEIHLINDKKIIYSIKITDNYDKKLLGASISSWVEF